MNEGERGPFSSRLRVRIKDNNSSPHGKFHRFLFPFSCKFPDLNLVSYVLYIYIVYLCGTHSEPGLPVFVLYSMRPKEKQVRPRTQWLTHFVHVILIDEIQHRLDKI